MFDLTDRMLRQFAENVSCEALERKLDALAASIGDEAFSKRIAREIVSRTKPHQAIPEIYARYRSVVRDGIEFFLSQVGRQRLVQVTLHQLQLPPGTGTQERLVELAKHFPTLHKLGQLIARNSNIDPVVKTWLIHLENGTYGTPVDELKQRIRRQLESTGRRNRVRLHSTILSEASVGAVIRFRWRPPSSREEMQGVFKVLKPGIDAHLDEELAILEKTAAFLENHRNRYPLKDFRFLEVFQEIREMLENEIDLAAEQAHLAEAAHFYEKMEDTHIPRRLPLGTDTMTAMAYLKGPKVTDAVLQPKQRERLASILFEAIVCKPLFCDEESSLFHGDPHAGNLLAVEDPATGRLGIGLIDWTLAAHLSRDDRRKTVQLIQAVIKKDLGRMRRVIEDLTIHSPWDDPARRNAFREMVLGLIHSSAFAHLSQIKKAFKLLEELAYAGFVFPANLMLFRKAIFTLEGVIFDLCPSFDMDAAMTQYLAALITKEIPERIGNLFFPLADRPENYTSLISNAEFQSLLLYYYFDAVGSCYLSFADYFCKWGRLAAIPF